MIHGLFTQFVDCAIHCAQSTVLQRKALTRNARVLSLSGPLAILFQCFSTQQYPPSSISCDMFPLYACVHAWMYVHVRILTRMFVSLYIHVHVYVINDPNWDARAAWTNASQLWSCTCNYFVGSCGSTYPSHSMISSPLKFWLLSNFPYVVRTCTSVYGCTLYVCVYALLSVFHSCNSSRVG